MVTSNIAFTHTVTERLLRYVVIDTQSDPTSATCPSTEKQKDLGRVLAAELKAMGLKDAHLDDHGYVYATIPANTAKQVPVICFCSHMDTSPDCTGKNVKPQIVRNYRGGDIVLPGDPSQVIRAAEHPALADQIGNDIVTTDGTTLLGADNKAGVAEIVTAAEYLIEHPDVPHGTIRIAFTPDEEVGRGTAHFDVARFGAEYAYTMDGGARGEVESESFSADAMTVTFIGFNTHPGYAKGRMVNAIKVAADFINRLPTDRLSPETTDGYDGFVHPYVVHAGVERTSVKLLIRDFETAGLAAKEAQVAQLAQEAASAFAGARVELSVEESYRNMREILALHRDVVEYACDAVREAGLEVRARPIRGGTDGSKLSFMCLPTPNIFAGEHNFHSRLEWVSVEDMEKAVEVIVNLARIWATRRADGQGPS